MINISIDPVALNSIAFLLGFALNVFKTLLTNNISLKDYFLNFSGRSTLSVGGLYTTFMSIQTYYPDSTFIVYFLSAYMVDNILNKSPIDLITATKLTPKK